MSSFLVMVQSLYPALGIFFAYLRYFVGNAIYVWGAQGQNLSEMTQTEAEAWIRNREYNHNGITDEKRESNAQRSINLYRKRLAAGVNPIYAFDCSGLIMYFLQNLLHLCSDKSAQMLYDACDYHPAMTELREGDLLFYSQYNNPEKIGHVGVYIGDGQAIECRNHDVGVVITKLATRPWNFAGHLPMLDPYLTPQVEDHPKFTQVTSPMSKGDTYLAMQKALIAANFTDQNGDALKPDSKWGKKSCAAFMKMLTFYRGGESA